MTGLLDVLKEAALDTRAFDAFETSASRVALPKAILDQRLLLLLYGLGTNAGLKRVAGATTDANYEELFMCIAASFTRALCGRPALGSPMLPLQFCNAAVG